MTQQPAKDIYDAIDIVHDARVKVVEGPNIIWQKLYRVGRYLENQAGVHPEIKELEKILACE